MGQWIDNVARALASGIPRRTALKRLGGGLAGLAGATLLPGRATAQQQTCGTQVVQICATGAQCCNPSGPRGRCCTPPQQRCCVSLDNNVASCCPPGQICVRTRTTATCRSCPSGQQACFTQQGQFCCPTGSCPASGTTCLAACVQQGGTCTAGGDPCCNGLPCLDNGAGGLECRTCTGNFGSGSTRPCPATSPVCLPNGACRPAICVDQNQEFGWTLTASDGDVAAPPPSAQFVTGPGTPPLGTGSLEFRISSAGSDDAQARYANLHGVLLSDLTRIVYSTYVDQNNSGQAPYLILQVDYDNDGTFDDLLFFEPLYQGATFCPSNPQGPLALDTWQTWDALAGCWYSVFGTAGSGPGANVKPFSTFFTPAQGGDADARIVNSSPSGLGGFRIVTGFGAGAWDNFVGNADNVQLGVGGATPKNLVFNFEAGGTCPPQQCSSDLDCPRTAPSCNTAQGTCGPCVNGAVCANHPGFPGCETAGPNVGQCIPS